MKLISEVWNVRHFHWGKTVHYCATKVILSSIMAVVWCSEKEFQSVRHLNTLPEIQLYSGS